MRFLSFGIRGKAKRQEVDYSFLFMKSNGDQLREITSLVESSVIRPVVDRVFPFLATNDALAYVETGRAKGKVVVNVNNYAHFCWEHKGVGQRESGSNVATEIWESPRLFSNALQDADSDEAGHAFQ
jgi:hypothetical protein